MRTTLCGSGLRCTAFTCAPIAVTIHNNDDSFPSEKTPRRRYLGEMINHAFQEPETSLCDPSKQCEIGSFRKAHKSGTVREFAYLEAWGPPPTVYYG